MKVDEQIPKYPDAFVVLLDRRYSPIARRRNVMSKKKNNIRSAIDRFIDARNKI